MIPNTNTRWIIAGERKPQNKSFEVLCVLWLGLSLCNHIIFCYHSKPDILQSDKSYLQFHISFRFHTNSKSSYKLLLGLTKSLLHIRCLYSLHYNSLSLESIRHQNQHKAHWHIWLLTILYVVLLLYEKEEITTVPTAQQIVIKLPGP